MIRDFQSTEHEYLVIAGIEKVIWPENSSSASDFKFQDSARDKSLAFQRVVVEQANEIVAFGHWRQKKINGRYQIDISVHPDFERQGIGTAVFEHLFTKISQSSPPVEIIEAYTYSHKPRAVAFLENRGFQPVMRWIISTLDVAQFNVSLFQPLIDQVTKDIKIVPLPQFMKQDPDWQRSLYELDWEIAQDEPLPYEPQKPPFDLYCKHEFENPKQVMDAWHVAVANGRLVGMTQLFRSDDPTMFKNGFTGTVRSHRRLGLATVLKLHAIQYAQKTGIKLIRTGNEEKNPMYQLNQKLGFTALTINIAFEKRVG